ncbi:MAG: hypothetical protein ACAI43_09965 [Phycisphaerae bacterium]
MLRFAAALVGALWAFDIGLTACAAIWWPGHGILENSVGQWVGGAVVLSCVLAAPVFIGWRADRKTVWVVDEAVVTARRGGAAARSVAWSEICSLRALPLAAILRARSTPYVERLNWIGAADRAWLAAVWSERAVGGGRAGRVSSTAEERIA